MVPKSKTYLTLVILISMSLSKWSKYRANQVNTTIKHPKTDGNSPTPWMNHTAMRTGSKGEDQKRKHGFFNQPGLLQKSPPSQIRARREFLQEEDSARSFTPTEKINGKSWYYAIIALSIFKVDIIFYSELSDIMNYFSLNWNKITLPTYLYVYFC